MRALRFLGLTTLALLALAVTGCGGTSPSTPTSTTPVAIPGLIGTGVNITNGVDTVWDIECTNLNASTPACPAVGFQRPARITVPAFEWVTPPAGGSWLGVNDAATLPTGIADSAERYQYIYRMQFDLTGFEPATARITLEWAADNYFGGYRFNASSFVSGGSADRQWSTYKTLTLQSPADTFVAGRNLLEFRIVGDGVTDGFIVRSFSGTAVRR